MSWASHAITKLKAGEQVTIHPRGNSMLPLVKSGEAVTLEPLTPEVVLLKGDIVLVHVAGRDYLHLIVGLKIEPLGTRNVETIRFRRQLGLEGKPSLGGNVRVGKCRYQIGNNKGRINGWVGREHIFGRKVRG